MTANAYDDAAAYERFMGAWSRAAVPLFLEWLHAPRAARWLDVGCGTGILAARILAASDPAAVHGVDPASGPLLLAKERLGPSVPLEVARAEALPYGAASFDVVASALVINFITDKPRAVAEMRRVLRQGGTAGAFVWDFAGERSPSGPLRRALRKAGTEVPPLPGTAESGLDQLARLFEDAAFADVATHSFEVTVPFVDFEDFWSAQTQVYGPMARAIAAMSDAARAAVKQSLRDSLPDDDSGRFGYAARVHAVKAIAVPGG